MTLTLRRHPQIFDRSRLKDGYRGILDRAKEDGAVLIRDAGEENLYIVREDVFGAFESAREESLDFAQFVAGVEHAITKGVPPRAILLGRLSWAAELSPESFRLFVTEYVTAFVRAMNSGEWRPLRQLLVEWRDTALIEGDPELFARIVDQGDAKDHEELARPADLA